jgi:hypothetical protein
MWYSWEGGKECPIAETNFSGFFVKNVVEDNPNNTGKVGQLWLSHEDHIYSFKYLLPDSTTHRSNLAKFAQRLTTIESNSFVELWVSLYGSNGVTVGVTVDGIKMSWDK